MSEEKKIIGQECEHYNEGHCLCYSDESQYPHCIEYPNCYFKQNKRLREALEKLQDNLDNILLPDYEEDYGNYNAFYQSSSAVIRQALGE